MRTERQLRMDSPVRTRGQIGLLALVVVGSFALWLLPAASGAEGTRVVGTSGAVDKELEADLNGFAEVDPETGEFGAGDLNGDGLAEITLRPAARTVCFRLRWNDVVRPIAAHIHEGRVGQNGPIVVDLLGNADPFVHRVGRGRAEGCAEGVSRALIREIIEHRARFYVNVHNERFPGGAIRGNLEREEPRI